MKRVIRRAVVSAGLLTLIFALATPPADAGGRHRHRVTYYGYSCGTPYYAHHVSRSHRGVHRVRVHSAPIVVVPVVPVPYYSYYRGPSDYFYHR